MSTASIRAWKQSMRLVRPPYLGGRRSLPSSTTNPSVRDHSFLGCAGSGRGGEGRGREGRGGEGRGGEGRNETQCIYIYIYIR